MSRLLFSVESLPQLTEPTPFLMKHMPQSELGLTAP